ncbi:hypothetical protein ACWGHD_18995 [Streptomyces xanthophaeus]
MTIIETADEARKRRAATATAATAGNLMLFPLESWFLMLLLGALHTTFPVVPAIGYGTALVVILSVLLAAHLADKFHRLPD